MWRSQLTELDVTSMSEANTGVKEAYFRGWSSALRCSLPAYCTPWRQLFGVGSTSILPTFRSFPISPFTRNQSFYLTFIAESVCVCILVIKRFFWISFNSLFRKCPVRSLNYLNFNSNIFEWLCFEYTRKLLFF